MGIIRIRTSGAVAQAARAPVRCWARLDARCSRHLGASGGRNNRHASAASAEPGPPPPGAAGRAPRDAHCARATSRTHVTVGQRHRRAGRRKVARRTQFCLAECLPVLPLGLAAPSFSVAFRLREERRARSPPAEPAYAGQAAASRKAYFLPLSPRGGFSSCAALLLLLLLRDSCSAAGSLACSRAPGAAEHVCVS